MIIRSSGSINFEGRVRSLREKFRDWFDLETVIGQAAYIFAYICAYIFAYLQLGEASLRSSDIVIKSIPTFTFPIVVRIDRNDFFLMIALFQNVILRVT